MDFEDVDDSIANLHSLIGDLLVEAEEVFPSSTELYDYSLSEEKEDDVLTEPKKVPLEEKNSTLNTDTPADSDTAGTTEPVALVEDVKEKAETQETKSSSSKREAALTEKKTEKGIDISSSTLEILLKDLEEVEGSNKREVKGETTSGEHFSEETSSRASLLFAEEEDTTPTVESSPSSFAGRLQKRGARFKTWRKRFFILTAEKLLYYVNEKSTKPRGEISLKGATLEVMHLPPSRKGFPFSLVADGESGTVAKSTHPKRTYLFIATTEGDRKEWMDCIQNNIARVTKCE